jgi:NO-binding membrane sensor protein with MHYT domain
MNTIHYEPFLVGLSYVISVFGSYVALQLATAILQGRSWGAVIGSVIGAAVAVGGGAIWSMHFIAMNAADLGIPVVYDPFLTFLSLAFGILAPAVGLFIVGRSDGGPFNLPLGGVLTGAGVALMHYTGMAAMIMPAKISYDPTLFWAANAIAIVAATVALWLAFNLRGNLQRFGSAFVMGIAVCGMHHGNVRAEAGTDEGSDRQHWDRAVAGEPGVLGVRSHGRDPHAAARLQRVEVPTHVERQPVRTRQRQTKPRTSAASFPDP